MKKIAFIALALAVSCNSTQKTTSDSKISKTVAVNPTTYAQTITEGELKTHLYIYASDEFEGREAGKPGQKKAIEYLRNEYKKLGIQAAKADGDYFQDVPLEISKLPTGTLTVNGKDYVLGEDYVSTTAAIGNYDAIVYVGYGIEEGSYSDYSNLDVKGKIVFAKTGEPKKADGTYVLSGSTEQSDWSKESDALGKRAELAQEKGANGIIFYDENLFPRFQQFFARMQKSGRERVSLKPATPNSFATLLVGSNLASTLVKDIASTHTPKSIATDLKLNLVSGNTDVKSENVVAVIKGSEKPNEYLVISSHLDHIGINKDGEINNGADDDGSGTVALLEIAQAFRTAELAGNGPKRSVVFLHVTAEEKGLLGSQHYTDVDPIFPLEQTVANLNIDMVGRIDPKREGDRNYIYLIGADKLSSELHNLSEEVNTKYMNIELDYTYNDENDPNRFYYRSDHYNFAKNNIPIIFYFNGTHDDYHQPGDTPDKINYDLLENRSRLVFYTAWEIANRAERLVVDKAE
ncbi:M28 family peptidase [Cellulophaga sp. F20128]|uniref:M28 family peptidase n=1 Tax=Cellulophaga sp. F20128 TaxID=2926413 RepID=UPI001FF1CFA5|nr:M28 family peptidase [Cellulophaga sp. F20128]MCK0157071.1 M28 family peptidase [Cellulophaga sp. F20128]